MNFGLEGKIALVTGAAGGIGSATATLFARQGAAVGLFDRDGDGAERVASRGAFARRSGDPRGYRPLRFSTTRLAEGRPSRRRRLLG